MNYWKDIAASDDIGEEALVSVELSEKENVILVRSGTELHAWGNSVRTPVVRYRSGIWRMES